MSGEWTRNKRLAALISERGLMTRGFRRSLRALVSEYCATRVADRIADCEECNGKCPRQADCEREEYDYLFTEWFLKRGTAPTAYKIEREGAAEGIWDVTVHVYEVENSVEIPDWKLGLYGDLADGDGPHFDLHILDRWDHEVVIPSEELMAFATIGLHGDHTYHREILKGFRSKAVAQHHSPVIVDQDGAANLRHQLKAAQRQLARRDASEHARIVQDVIYGLGRGISQKEIAANVGVPPLVVRVTARVLKAQSVNPRLIVKDSHAKWKAAYDALRELGIQP